jgi:hypothetical protein
LDLPDRQGPTTLWSPPCLKAAPVASQQGTQGKRHRPTASSATARRALEPANMASSSLAPQFPGPRSGRVLLDSGLVDTAAGDHEPSPIAREASSSSQSLSVEAQRLQTCGCGPVHELSYGMAAAGLPVGRSATADRSRPEKVVERVPLGQGRNARRSRAMQVHDRRLAGGRRAQSVTRTAARLRANGRGGAARPSVRSRVDPHNKHIAVPLGSV